MPNILPKEKTQNFYQEIDKFLHVYNMHDIDEKDRNRLLKFYDLPPWIFEEDKYHYYTSCYLHSFSEDVNSFCYYMDNNIQANQFYFTAKLLKGIFGKYYFNYRSLCFADYKHSYIVTKRFGLFSSPQGYPKGIMPLKLREFLFDCLIVLQEFDTKNAVGVFVKGSSNFCYIENDPTHLSLYFENEFYEAGQECYIKRYKFLERKHEIKDVPIFIGKNENKYLICKADRLWNKYKFVFLVRYLIKYAKLKPNKSFLIKLNEYYRRIYSSDREEISWKELGYWIDDLYNTNSEEVVEKVLMPKTFFDETGSEESNDEYS